jgi:cyclopropane fatty-acyl-phospholipid synthase-like methyltransferase
MTDLGVALPPGSQVLDLGCGAGDYLAEAARLPGVEAIGIDRDAASLAIATERLGPAR